MKSKTDLIFVGCRDKISYLAVCADLTGYNVLGILDSHYYGNTESIEKIPIIGDERWLLDPKHQQAQKWLQHCVFFPANHWHGNQFPNLALDLQAHRKNRIKILEQADAKIVSLIFPGLYQKLMQSKYCDIKIGKGVYVGPGVSISPHHVVIDDYAVIYDNAKIDANSHIGKNVFVCVNTYLYNCALDEDSFFGMNASILIAPYLWHKSRDKQTKIIIGKNTTVWAGASVDRNVPDNCIFTHTGKILQKRRATLDSDS